MEDTMGLASDIATEVIAGLNFAEDDPDLIREQFTQRFVAAAATRLPNANVVIIHPQHDRWGTFNHEHVEMPGGGGTIGYEVYFAEKGRGFSLANQGDGGFMNWAFIGEFTRDGNTIFASEHPTTSEQPTKSDLRATVFDDHNFEGKAQELSVGVYDWGAISNDTISSLRVPPGLKVTLFVDTHFQGGGRVFTQDARYVGNDMNDKTSSIVVEFA
jgi:hypothetical protein